uniref:Uncharacterized protein n=1 Tax=Sphaerodactylus townsendi TaxID=933632 RepID=A0ACB8F7W3_9SAUR
MVRRKKRQSILLDFLHLKPSVVSAGSGKMQELILKERRMSEFTDEQVETSFQKWEESGKLKSDILGHSYKPKVPRPPLKGLSDVKGCIADKEQTRIYHCIQYTQLRPVPDAQIPESLRDAEQQAQAAAEQRAARKGKRWAALSSLVAKPSVRSFMRQKQALYTKEATSFTGLA